ncbi:hypothetical protein AYI68_g6393 [Smittium mucronatum]|uniref:Uncharacterized protein n=1 Tax=Smittium mucronatum TaxID=133383 RepID=A0A1R0GRN2_9FUNG|nr:hypothetical protein AYI68_g6393 [Smittium mucronatum]
MEYLVSSLLGLSLSSGPNSPIRFSLIIPIVGAVQTFSVFSTRSNGLSEYRRSKGEISALRSMLGEGDGCVNNSALSVASSLVT